MYCIGWTFSPCRKEMSWLLRSGIVIRCLDEQCAGRGISSQWFLTLRISIVSSAKWSRRTRKRCSWLNFTGTYRTCAYRDGSDADAQPIAPADIRLVASLLAGCGLAQSLAIMNRLLDIGFKAVGHWLLTDGKLSFNFIRYASERNILYSFVCDGQVKYVGKSVRSLSERLYGYKNPGLTQSTNIKNHNLLKDAIAAGATIEIFALPDRGLIHYGVFHLNLAAALEDDIIRVMNPDWNGSQPKPATVLYQQPSLMATEGVEKVQVVEDAHLALPPVLHRFKFTLQPTYRKAGFFNVGVDAQRYIGSDGETIELFLGKSAKSTLGTINRRANSNETPRIMGGTRLRDWFQSSATVMQDIEVHVMSPVSIRLLSNDG